MVRLASTAFPRERLTELLMQQEMAPTRNARPPAHVARVEHASDAVAERVRAWFAGEKLKRTLDGDRSVIIAHPEKPGFGIKIKGAGLLGKGGRVFAMTSAGSMRIWKS